jgi:hypothetical protein
MKQYELTLTFFAPNAYDKQQAEEFIQSLLGSQEPAENRFFVFKKLKFVRKIKEEVALAA